MESESVESESFPNTPLFSWTANQKKTRLSKFPSSKTRPNSFILDFATVLIHKPEFHVKMTVKTAVLLFLVLLNVSMAKSSTDSWRAAVTVGKIFLESFTSADVKETDLTAAEELVRGLTFDKYDEKISCKILTKIKERDFETVVSRIATRHQIPANIQESILDGQYGNVNKEVVREFKFEKGSPGRVLYGRTVSIKREDSTIDLAYAFFYLEFKLSPSKIMEHHRDKFLGIFAYAFNTVVRFEERNLSEKEMERIFDFYRAKALKGFNKEYPALANERFEL